VIAAVFFGPSKRTKNLTGPQNVQDHALALDIDPGKLDTTVFNPKNMFD